MAGTNRRSAIKNMLAGTAAIGASGMLSSFTPAERQEEMSEALKGNINHAVCRWCYNDLSLSSYARVQKILV
jgi:hydroxypyruvate isomerase